MQMQHSRVADSYIIWLTEFLKRYGVTSKTLFDTAGLDPALLDDVGYSVTGEQHYQLLAAARQLVDDPALGLHMGFNSCLPVLGEYGYALLSSRTLRESIAFGLRYQSFTGRFSGRLLFVTFHEDNGTARFCIDTRPGLGELRVMAIEEILGTIRIQLELVSGQPITVRALHLDYEAPAYAQIYRELFDCPVQFDHARTELVFDAAILDRPFPQANPGLASMYRRECERVTARSRDRDPVRTIEAAIDADPGHVPGLEAIASDLAISPRTLRRQLKHLGTNFQAVVTDARLGQARSYLADTQLSVDEIAQRLGYNTTSSFRRAFKHWSGHTPGDVRRGRS